jgi:hypothetical protein
MLATRTARLIAFLEANVTATNESGNALVRVADLTALLAVVKAAAKEMPAASNVPEWDNHTSEAGKPNAMGDVAATYACWIEDADVDHDGACQLAKVAEATRGTFNALDRLCFAGNGR